MGLRSQLLLALGGLCVLAFVPLFFAVASLSRITLRLQQETQLQALGQATATRLLEAQGFAPDADVQGLAKEAMDASPLVWGCAFWTPDGTLIGSRARDDALSWPSAAPPRSVMLVATPRGNAWQIGKQSPAGSVSVLVAAEGHLHAPLTRLIALYTASIAICLMIFLYAALTRLVIQPLDDLARAADRVASGARMLEVPRRGAEELRHLGASMATMTDQLRDEEEKLRRQVMALEQANSKLQEAQQQVVRSAQLASVGRLAAGLAHEVGNPLAALVGLQDMMLADQLDPAEQTDFLLRMRQETERIHRIVQNLLDFSRPSTTSKHAPVASSTDVETTVREVVALLQHQRGNQDVATHVIAAPHLPRVRIGHDELIQVLMNLLLNAMDAMGGAGTIWLRATHLHETVTLEVEDDGPGIDPSVQDTLFEPFVTTKAVGHGTGLGLAVCRGLVAAIGGSLLACARPHQQRGVIFRVVLPAVPGSEQTEVAAEGLSGR